MVQVALPQLAATVDDAREAMAELVAGARALVGAA